MNAANLSPAIPQLPSGDIEKMNAIRFGESFA